MNMRIDLGSVRSIPREGVYGLNFVHQDSQKDTVNRGGLFLLLNER